MILSGDIGGTKTHLALFNPSDPSLRPAVVRSYPSRRYSSLIEVLREMLRENPAHVSAAAFGIAGPIIAGRSKLTNLGWDVDGREVAMELSLPGVGLLNDLEAMAYGTLHIPPEERVVLQAGERQPERAIAVIAAGTGLGMGGLFWDGACYRAIPTEGGHSDFGPRDETEIDLLRFLTRKFGRVSYERIVSGPGLVNLYEFFRARADYPEPEWLKAELASGDSSAVISAAGLAGRDPVCVQALERFVSVYGAESGNLALKMLSTGGVVVGGGIAPKILPAMQNGSFMRSFVTKGRYQKLLENMPVEIILNDKAALIGAAHYAAVMMTR